MSVVAGEPWLLQPPGSLSLRASACWWQLNSADATRRDGCDDLVPVDLLVPTVSITIITLVAFAAFLLLVVLIAVVLVLVGLACDDVKS